MRFIDCCLAWASCKGRLNKTCALSRINFRGARRYNTKGYYEGKHYSPVCVPTQTVKLSNYLLCYRYFFVNLNWNTNTAIKFKKVYYNRYGNYVHLVHCHWWYYLHKVIVDICFVIPEMNIFTRGFSTRFRNNSVKQKAILRNIQQMFCFFRVC